MATTKGKNSIKRITDYVRSHVVPKVWAKMTADQISAMVAQDCHIHVNVNSVCRILRREGIVFKADDNDPPESAKSRMDLLKSRIVHMEEWMTYLEERVEKLEGKSKKK